MCKEACACNDRVDLISLEKGSIHKWLLELQEWMLLLLAIGATTSCTRTSESKSALARCLTVSLHISSTCHYECVGVLVLLFAFCFGVVLFGCFCLACSALPSVIVDVFLKLASLDMTATILSNAASGKNSPYNCEFPSCMPEQKLQE